MNEWCRLTGEYSTWPVQVPRQKLYGASDSPFKRLPSALRSPDRLILCRSSPPRVRWLGLEHRSTLTVRWDQRAKIS